MVFLILILLILISILIDWRLNYAEQQVHQKKTVSRKEYRARAA